MQGARSSKKPKALRKIAMSKRTAPGHENHEAAHTEGGDPSTTSKEARLGNGGASKAGRAQIAHEVEHGRTWTCPLCSQEHHATSRMRRTARPGTPREKPRSKRFSWFVRAPEGVLFAEKAWQCSGCDLGFRR